VTDEDQIAAYLRDIDALLDTDDPHRQRVLSEIDGHLRDSAAEHADRGASLTQAAAEAITEFGPPHLVAAGFSSESTGLSTVRGARRWLPAVLPGVLLILCIAGLLWTLTQTTAGSLGQHAALWIYLRSTTVAAVLFIGAVWAIRNADHDRKWRLAAWSCTAFALLFYVL
jgi:hypothetical protein